MTRVRTVFALAGSILLAGTAVVVSPGVLQQDDVSSSPVDASIRGVSDEHGSIQSIQGIKGIDSVMLENLEVVLRMQDRPQAEQRMGTARTAANLLSAEPTVELEDIPDARDIHEEFELEGS